MFGGPKSSVLTLAGALGTCALGVWDVAWHRSETQSYTAPNWSVAAALQSINSLQTRLAASGVAVPIMAPHKGVDKEAEVG